MEGSEQMRSVLRGAFGPSGRALLAQTSSQLVITKSGSTILDLVFSSTTTTSDPILSELLHSASQLHNMFGDGVKSYVILLHALFNQITFKNVRSVVNKFLFAQAVIEDCFRHKKCQCVLTDEILKNVINTFFLTRFTPFVAGKLSCLVFEWVSKLPSCSQISTYLCNFSTLCLTFSPSSLFLSKIQDGFLLKGIYKKKLPGNEGKCSIKVYYYDSDDTPDITQLDSIIDILQENNNVINLLVTNVSLEDRVLFLLSVQNIYVIHSVSKDSAKFLFECSLKNMLIVKYCFFNEFLWVSLEHISQLLLKTPNASLSAEYVNGIEDCLKMLFHSFTDSSCIVNAGGYFEQALAKKLFNLTKGVEQRIPFVGCRKDVIAWKALPENTALLQHIDISTLDRIDFEVSEIIIKALLAIQNSDSDQGYLEPLELRLTVIIKALNTFINICRLDRTMIIPKKGRLV